MEPISHHPSSSPESRTRLQSPGSSPGTEAQKRHGTATRELHGSGGDGGAAVAAVVVVVKMAASAAAVAAEEAAEEAVAEGEDNGGSGCAGSGSLGVVRDDLRCSPGPGAF